MSIGLDQARIPSQTDVATRFRPADIAALLRFLDATATEGNPRRVGTIFDATIRRLGFGDFSMRLARSSATNGTLYDRIWTYPTPWEEHFRASGYVLVSPGIFLARRLRRPFNWFEVLALPTLSEAQKKVYREASEFSIGMGLVVPIHAAHGPPSMFAVNADQALDPTADAIRVYEKRAQLLGLGFFERAGPLLQGQQMALREPASFDVANDNTSLGDMTALYEMPHGLTPFERECLAWSAAGLDRWAISERFSLSEALVNRALLTARLKLGVATEEHAVVRAIARKLVTI